MSSPSKCMAGGAWAAGRASSGSSSSDPLMATSSSSFEPPSSEAELTHPGGGVSRSLYQASSSGLGIRESGHRDMHVGVFLLRRQGAPRRVCFCFAPRSPWSSCPLLGNRRDGAAPVGACLNSRMPLASRHAWALPASVGVALCKCATDGLHPPRILPMGAARDLSQSRLAAPIARSTAIRAKLTAWSWPSRVANSASTQNILVSCFTAEFTAPDNSCELPDHSWLQAPMFAVQPAGGSVLKRPNVRQHERQVLHPRVQFTQSCNVRLELTTHDSRAPMA